MLPRPQLPYTKHLFCSLYDSDIFLSRIGFIFSPLTPEMDLLSSLSE